MKPAAPVEDSTGDETPGMWLVLPTAGFAFVVPISMSLSDLLRYCPIGLPMITISKGWPKGESK